jgi:hypothetical protein
MLKYFTEDGLRSRVWNDCHKRIGKIMSSYRRIMAINYIAIHMNCYQSAIFFIFNHLNYVYS